MRLEDLKTINGFFSFVLFSPHIAKIPFEVPETQFCGLSRKIFNLLHVSTVCQDFVFECVTNE